MTDPETDLMCDLVRAFIVLALAIPLGLVVLWALVAWWVK